MRHVALGRGHQVGIVELGQQAKHALQQQVQLVVDGGVQGHAVVGHQPKQQLGGQAELIAQQMLEYRSVGRCEWKPAQRPQR